MTTLDWSLVFLLNGTIIIWGFVLARGTHSSEQWFLGARALPWWGVGMSMFATNVDNADLVAVTGTTYNQGLHIVSVYAIGSALGGILASFLVVPVISRKGYYTNAEYLEGRFGPSMRVISALIQLQYRSSMLGLMIWSIFLLLTRLIEIPPVTAWVLIVTAVLLAGLYTAGGGLRSVVWTDALQGVVMLIGAAVIFSAIWSQVGGWHGMKSTLDAAGEVNGTRLSDLPHVAGYRGKDGQTPPWLIVVGWTIIGTGYWTVNHTQTMRLMGCRSVWDMRMAAVLGVGASLPVMIACACLGVFARSIPEFQSIAPNESDTIYPLLAKAFLGPGLKGLVVAGLFAAAVSTFDSMGSALSAIFTRDIYARFLVRDGDDAHYLKVGRWATIGVLTLGFLYLPFIIAQENMLRAFTTLIPVFVTPLFTVYMAGVMTRCHRRSGLIGLAAGSLFGVLALIDREGSDTLTWLPQSVSSQWAALVWSLGITAAAVAVASWGFRRFDGASSETPAHAPLPLAKSSPWLDSSRDDLPPLLDHPFEGPLPAWLNPWLWAAALLAFCGWVVGVFW